MSSYYFINVPEFFDVIIVGAGHNGLVTAAYLARAGRRVLVLESRELVGGCAVTEEIWPGYRVSTASYLSSLMQEKVVRELELEKFGYQVDAKDPAFFSPFPDGRHLFMWQDRVKTLAEIAKFSPKDAAAYPKYEAHLERLAIVAESLLLTTPPDFPPRGPGDYLEYLKLAGKLKGLTPNEIVGLVKIFTQSAADFLDQWFESEQLKVTLATDGVIGANGGPKSPGTAYILLHHCMGGVNGHRGLWGFVRGGMGAVSNAIADSARAKGVTIRTSAPVAKILVRAGRANGVVLDSGEEIQSKVVASNLDPRRTFLKLVEAQRDLPPALPRVDKKLPLRRHVAQNEPRPQRTSRVHGLPRIARPPASRDHAYLPQRRIHRACLGRRKVRKTLAKSAPIEDDHPDDVRPLRLRPLAATSWEFFCNTPPTLSAGPPGTRSVNLTPIACST